MVVISKGQDTIHFLNVESTYFKTLIEVITFKQHILSLT